MRHAVQAPSMHAVTTRPARYLPIVIAIGIGWTLAALLIAGTCCAEDTEVPAVKEPRWRVLIIGDSISIGYTPTVQSALRDSADVIHNPGNAQHSGFGRANLDAWLGAEPWDVIHFNHGLHDLKYVDQAGKNTRSRETGHIQVSLEQYAENLTAIVQRLQRTGATLIFATTTPFPDQPHGPLRDAAEVARYNRAAVEVMRREQVAVNDLHDFVAPRMQSLMLPNNVHFTKAGSRALGEKVAQAITAALPLRNAAATGDVTSERGSDKTSN